jgi:hypothetical protein
MTRCSRACLLALGLTLLTPGLAAGQKKCAEAAKTNKKRYVIETGPDGKKVYRLTSAFVVCGSVPKPSVLYNILSSTVNYEWENLKQDFLPLVIQSVEENPF